MKRILEWIGAALIVGILASCASQQAPSPEGPLVLENVPDTAPLGPVLQRQRSRWVPVRWADLPGFGSDDTHAAWAAWLQSCIRPVAPFVQLCSEVRRLTLATPDEQREWMRMRLQPYRVVADASGSAEGLLTSYFEPEYPASRVPQGAFQIPIYAPPPNLPRQRPWYTRREIDTRPDVRAQLAGSEIAWMADPIDAMILQIQGSGRLRVREPDGSERLVRLTYAATNNQPYRSPGRWLKDQGLISDATWPGIKAFLAFNPDRVQEFLWSNPRVVFFHEEPLSPQDAEWGPRGAQGVALTPGRSIAVDPKSIPYGTPVWLASQGPTANLERLVLAQDTGSAIQGGVRADYYAGSGAEAGELAGRLNQPLRLWVLWPKH
jgi:membrane-bound lytic murein transglycosylase A